MATELPAAALTDLGDDLYNTANNFIAEFEKANERPLTKVAAERIADIVFPEDTRGDEAVEKKHGVLLGHLYSVVKRAGEPTSEAAQELLAAANKQKETNAATGLKTQELILANEWAAVILKSRQDLSPNEFMILQNTRANKSDQIAMLPAGSQAEIYASAAAIVKERGG